MFYHSLNEKKSLTLNKYESINKDDKMEIDDFNLLSDIKKETFDVLKNNNEINSKSLFHCNIILQSLVEGAAFVLR